MTDANTTEAVIREDELYSREEVMKRLGIAQPAWTAARRNGLPVHKLGKRFFVSGRELIEWVRSLSA